MLNKKRITSIVSRKPGEFVFVFSLLIGVCICLTLFLDLSGIDNLWMKTGTTFFIFLFSLPAFGSAPKRLRWGIPAGLFLCTVADFFIILNFISGLVFFIFAHILFIITFISFSRRVSLVAAIISFSISILVFFLIIMMSFDERIIPAALYTIMVSLMLATVFTLIKTDLTFLQKVLFIGGAVLFYVSDIIISFHEFQQPIPYFIVYNYPVYFAGLTCIAAALYPLGKTSQRAENIQ